MGSKNGSPPERNRFRRPSLDLVGQPSVPTIKTTFQLSGSLLPEAGSKDTPDATLQRARAIVLDWLGKFPLGKFPAAAAAGESFLHEFPGHSVEVIAIPEHGLWCARLEHPDMGLGKEIPAVAGRTWTADFSLAICGKEVAFGVQVRCANLPGVTAPVVCVRPRPVRDWAGAFRLVAPIHITEVPLQVTQAAELGQLKGFLEDPIRDLPVVVLTSPDGRNAELVRNPWVLDSEALAKTLLGFAHVVLLPSDLTYQWSDLLDGPWGVYNGAVRVYRPGLDFDTQSPFAHPLTTLDRILRMEQDGRPGEQVFTERLVASVSEVAAGRPRRFDRTPFIPQARGIIAGVERQKMMDRLSAESKGTEQAAALKTQLDLIREQNELEKASYEQQIQDLRQKADESLNLAISHEEESNRYKAEASGMKWQITDLLSRLRTAGQTALEPELPKGYEDMPDWVRRNLAGRLRLHPRAERALKEAIYEDVQVVYKALLTLANDYQPSKVGEADAKELFDQRLHELGLEFGKSITSSRAGEEADDYFVKWPHGDPSAPRRFLEWHLRKGTTHDKRRCLAIYFFWDDDECEVVVGWLPSHLDNRLT